MATLLALGAALMATSCAGDLPEDGGSSGTAFNPNEPADPDKEPIPEEAYDILNERVESPNEALRTASLKILRRFPTLDEITEVETGGRASYEALLDAMFETPEFSERMIKWWQDIMRQGGADPGDDRNAAPTLAAQLIVEGRPFMQVLTATDNCSAYDAANNAFVAAPCNSGAPAEAGVLTNPGVMRQFYGTMAFRRVRWVQEIFTCRDLPVEEGATPQDVGGGGSFQGPWAFTSISGAPVNFLGTDGVVCANCHQTMNHMAPLFGRFDMDGRYLTDGYGVVTNVNGEAVPSQLEHWLPAGQTTAWRFGKPAADLPALGAAIAADPQVHACMVKRAWNFVMSKEDIVSAGAIVPDEIVAPFLERFKSGFDLKDTLRAMFKSDDFLKR
ncbi:hypothetical protein [Chondromyces apiculatus]|uniref:DUF1549 domain-containing protein n=1 Tax=Chondromyces apiculatus DSM 436 TaxID=1192034 RepID=A0A017TGZ7_9BACT|nr:hypothetical protein [Chondromyces apiculatus]EYF08519.1 Hypothetical protein CAP_4049 [Chondromyces apiculatus DSM 436]